MNFPAEARAGSGQGPRIAVIIACYNAASTVASVVQKFRQHVPSADVYVFDHDSTDGTAEEAARAGALVVRMQERRASHVVPATLRRIRADVYVLVDGDDTYPADAACRLIRPIAAGEADMAIASRLPQGSSSPFRPVIRVGNLLYRELVALMFGIRLTDLLSGYRAFSRRFVRGVPRFSGGVDTGAEMTVKALLRGFTVVEIPVDLEPRPSVTESKIRLVQDGVSMLTIILTMVVTLVRDYKPLTFLGSTGLILVAVGSIPAASVVADYVRTGLVTRPGAACVATALLVLGSATTMLGLILHTIVHRFQELDLQLQMLADDVRTDARAARRDGNAPLSLGAKVSVGLPIIRRGPWMVTLCLALAVGWFIVTAVSALGRPLNAGDDHRWALVFLGLAVVALLSNVVPRASDRVFWIGVPGLGSVLIVLSGQLRAAVITAWLLVLAAVLGSFIVRLLGVAPSRGPLDCVAVTTPLGLAALACVGLVLSLTRMLRPWPVFITLAILTLLRTRPIMAGARRLRQRWWALMRGGETATVPERASLMLVFGASFLLALTWDLAPEIQFDALNYQLAVPRIYLAAGRLVDLPYFFHSYFAHLVNMIFALGLALHGQAVAKLLTLAMAVMATAGVYALGRRTCGPRVGMWAAALFCSTPLVGWLASTTYTDLAATLFLLASVLALVRWWDSMAVGWVAVSGALCGAGLSTKLTATVALPALGALLVATGWLAAGASATRWAKAMGAYAIGLLLVAGPWYAVIYALTGNPFFPMLNGVFKSAAWPPVNTRLNADLFGTGTSPSALLALPFVLTFDTARFGEALAPGAMGLAVALLPLGVLWTVSAGRLARALSGMTLLTVALWAWLFQYARYLVPVLPFIVVLVAAALVATPDPWARRMNVTLLGLVVLAQFMVTPLLFWNVAERFPVSRALGFESDERFLSRALPGYSAALYINRVAVPGEWVVGMDFANVRFYLDPPLVSLESAGVLQVNDDASPRTLAENMIQRGYRYVMIDTRRPPAAAFPFMRADFLACCAVPSFARNGVVVHRVGAPRPSRPAVNLLHNPGFEQLTPRGDVDRWSAYGQPVVGRAESGPHAGSVAIGASPSDGLTQRVKVEAAALYLLGQMTRSDDARANARLQINWLNERDELVEASIEVVPARKTWTMHQMLVTAPDAAATAVVYVSVHDRARVWFDDFALTRVQ